MVVKQAAVLIVDDDEPVRWLLAEIVSDRPGWSVLTAGSGADALAQLDTARPDLIIIDIMMPGMNGVALYRRLRAREECVDVPVLFATVLSGNESTEQLAGLTGPHRLIHKPFELEAFYDIVDDMLRTDQNVSLSAKIASDPLSRAYSARSRSVSA